MMEGGRLPPDSRAGGFAAANLRFSENKPLTLGGGGLAGVKDDPKAADVID